MSNEKEQLKLKDFTGVLFNNNKKNERQPDIRGKISIDGKIYNVAGWEKKSQNGVVYHSLAIQDEETFLKNSSNSSISNYVESQNGKNTNETGKMSALERKRKEFKEKEERELENYDVEDTMVKDLMAILDEENNE